MNVDTEKICNKCNLSKSVDNFANKKGGKNGKNSHCKNCVRARILLHNEKKRYEYKKQINGKICSKCLIYKLKYNFAKNGVANDGLTSWCKDCKNEYDKNSKNDPKRKKSHSKARLNYIKKQKQTNPAFKMTISIRRRFSKLIKLQKTIKTSKTLSLLGCQVADFKNYIESLFKPGMNWGNYGFGENKWVLDHIQPVSSFNLLEENDKKICFHYSNFQPLWWRENMEKSDKI